MILKIRIPSDKLKVLDYISKLPDSKLYDVTVNIHRQTRSCPQNKLYWMWINCISKETGNDPADLHDYFRESFLWSVPKQVINRNILQLISTTKLNTAEFTEYLDKIQVFASAELGIVLPLPEDLIFAEFADYYQNRY